MFSGESAQITVIVFGKPRFSSL